MFGKVRAVCLITQNERGFHKVTYDNYASPRAWLLLPVASGRLVKQTYIKRPKRKRGQLCYEFLGEADARRYIMGQREAGGRHGAAYQAVLKGLQELYGEDFFFDKAVVDSESGTVTFWTHEAWERRREFLKKRQ